MPMPMTTTPPLLWGIDVSTSIPHLLNPIPQRRPLPNMNSTKDVSLHSSTYAAEQDSQDPLQHLRAAFVIPTRSDLTSDTAGPPASPSPDEHDHKEITYFCGNSLGLQPRLARRYLEQYLSTWATKGVHGHFKRLRDTALPPWLDCDSSLQDDMARLVGAQADEIAMMQTLTGNLHLMMCSFYRPTAQRWKIIMEGKAFPSDHVGDAPTGVGGIRLTSAWRFSMPLNPRSEFTTCPSSQA